MLRTTLRQLAPLLLVVAACSQTIAYAQSGPSQVQINGGDVTAVGAQRTESGSSFDVVTTVTIEPYLLVPKDFASAFVQELRFPGKGSARLQTNIGHPLTALAYFSRYPTVPPGAQAALAPSPVDLISGAAVNAYSVEVKRQGLTIGKTAGNQPPSAPVIVVALSSN